MRAKINGTELFIAATGPEDKPALILNHSLATSHEMWGLQLPVFARHFRVVAFDMRGHGASAAPKAAYTLDQLADDVVGVADHLGLKRFSFIGLSIGGMIGQTLGFRHGARLEKLILSSTLMGSVGAEGAKAWDERNALVKEKGVANQIDGTMARWLSADFQKHAPRTSQWIRDLIAATPADGYAGCGEAIKGMKLTADKIATIKTPTLVIAGEKDPGATPAMGAEIAAAIPGAKSYVIPGGYHLCNVEFPHLFTEHALSFLLGKGNG
ncbi:alpha/beta fold hydrolase [Dongia sp.]|uniref:alpha/beta fold hydrolase n=1 Tax=Dongia sp. TaxID=1977262 RepID=UPI0035B3D655